MVMQTGSELKLIRDYVINQILQTDARGYVKSRESTKLDFKQSFNWGSAAEYTRTMAAFANNQGGYLIFGVKDSPRSIVGLSGDAFENLTSEKISEFMKSHFSTAVDYEFESLDLNGKKIGWLYTRPSSLRPIICTSNSGKDLKDGVIYYRNGARSEAITSSHLQQMLEEQRQKDGDRWMSLFKNASKIGVENAAVLSLEDGVVSAPGGTVIIDEKIMDDIKFIREGEFDEKKGAPTLRIIGNVSSDGTAKVVEKVVDPDIKYPLTISEVGTKLGFTPPGSAGPNARALVIHYGLQLSQYMHEFSMGKAKYKKYSQEVVDILKLKAEDGEFEIDKDSETMKKIRKSAQKQSS
jgi:Putative DNA-binding domain